MRAFRILLAVAAVLTGCIPARDNPLDSANSPAPVLVVVDRSGNGACETEDPLENWPTVPVAFRGTCLALDARDTTDPQGTGLEDLRFTYERITDEANPVPIGTPFLDDVRGASIHLLAPSDVQQFPAGTETAFRVTVRDGGGATGSTTIHVTMLNRAPTADADPLRILPLAAPGSSASIDFHATATDPDGDDITAWRWTDNSGAELATTSSHTVSFATDTPSRHILWVEAFDGVTWSPRTPTPVRVGRAALWSTRDTTSDGTFEAFARIGDRRMHRSFLQGTTPIDASLTNGVAFHTSGTQTRVAVLAQQLLLLEWPGLTVLDTFDPAFNYDATGLRFDTEGRIWIGTTPYTDGFGDTVREVGGFDTTGDVLTPLTPANGKVPGSFPSSGNSTFVFMDSDTDGNLWAVGEYEEVVRAFDPSVSSILLLGSSATPAGSVFKGLTRRPGSPGMWAVQGQAFVGSEIAQPALLHFVAGPTGVQRTEIAVEAGDVDGLTWIDADRFWTSIAGRGLCVVNAATLEAGGTLDAAIELAYPTSISFTNVVSDPISGQAWWTSVFGTLVARTSIFGDIEVFAGAAAMKDVDPEGSFWFVSDPDYSGYGTLSAGEAPSFGSVAAEFAAGAITAVPDGEGGLWTATLIPRALQRFAANGELIDVITEVDRPEGIRTVPTILALGFDGRTLVAAGVESVTDPFLFLRIDVSDRVPFSETPPPAELITTFQAIPASRLHVPPEEAGQHFFWVDIFGPRKIYLTDAQGTTSEVLDFSGAESWDAAVSSVDGRLCVGDMNGLAADLYSITASGVATLTTSITFALPPERVGVSFSVDPVTGTERCWMGVREIDTIDFSPKFRLFVYDANGTFVRGYEDDAGEVLSMAVLGNDSLRILRSNAGEMTLEAFEWDALGNLSRIGLGRADYSSFVEP